MHISKIFAITSLLCAAVVSSPVPDPKSAEHHDNDDDLFDLWPALDIASTSTHTPNMNVTDSYLPFTTNTTNQLESRDVCYSWFYYKEKFTDGHVWKRFRFLLGTDAPEFRKSIVGEKEWNHKFKHVPWLWLHRLSDGKFHREMLECTGAMAHNKQIYYSDMWRSWVFDVSELRGKGGKFEALCLYNHMKWTWKQWTGCQGVYGPPENFNPLG